MKTVNFKNAKGFTLIELMIVVAIIGILAAIALPAYQRYAQKSRFAEVNTIGDGLKTAIAVCYLQEADISADGPCVTFSLASATTAGGTVAATTGQLGITPLKTKNLDSVAVAGGADNITVTLTGTAAAGGKNLVLVATPTGSDNQLVWTNDTSTCLVDSYCQALVQ